MSASERVRKSIPRTTFMLVSANKKVFSKNQTFPSLSWTEKPAMTIPLSPGQSHQSSFDQCLIFQPSFVLEWSPSDPSYHWRSRRSRNVKNMQAKCKERCDVWVDWAMNLANVGATNILEVLRQALKGGQGPPLRIIFRESSIQDHPSRVIFPSLQISMPAFLTRRPVIHQESSSRVTKPKFIHRESSWLMCLSFQLPSALRWFGSFWCLLPEVSMLSKREECEDRSRQNGSLNALKTREMVFCLERLGCLVANRACRGWRLVSHNYSTLYCNVSTFFRCFLSEVSTLSEREEFEGGLHNNC